MHSNSQIIAAAMTAANKAKTKKNWVANTAKTLGVSYSWLIKRTSASHLDFAIAMAKYQNWEKF